MLPLVSRNTLVSYGTMVFPSKFRHFDRHHAVVLQIDVPTDRSLPLDETPIKERLESIRGFDGRWLAESLPDLRL